VLLNEREMRRMTDDYAFLERFSPQDRIVYADWLANGLLPIHRWDQVMLFALR
jgi:hypothetical protein